VDELEAARAKRWGYGGRKIAAFDRASDWLDDLGFAFLTQHGKLIAPALWVIGSDDREQGWGPDAERLWRWKDELPLRRRAWYGHFIYGKKSFISPALLADLYSGDGKHDDFKNVELAKNSTRIAQLVFDGGPMSAAALREATGWTEPDFKKAITELGRALVVTHFGAEPQGSGWPSAIYELTPRVFKLKPTKDLGHAARTFLRTVLACKPAELARAFGWNAVDARAALDALVPRKEATIDGATYLAAGALLRR